jgi:hypothetical protein
MAKKKKKPRRRLSKVRVDEVSLTGSPAVEDSRFIVAKRDEEQAMSEEAQAVVEDVVKDALDAGAETPEAAEAEEAVAVAKAGESGDEHDAAESQLELTKQDDGAWLLKDGDAEPVRLVEEEVSLAKGADAWLRAIRGLRASASDMDPSGLEMLANIMRYTGFRYGEDEKVREALLKMDCDLSEFDEDADDVEKAMKVIGPTNFGKIEKAAGTIIENARTIQTLAGSAREIKKAEGEGDAQDEGETEPLEKGDEPPAAEETTEQQEAESVIDAVGRLLKAREVEAKRDAVQQMVEGIEKVAARLDGIEERQSAFAEGLKTATGKV